MVLMVLMVLMVSMVPLMPSLASNRRSAAVSPRQLRPRASGFRAPRRSSWSRMVRNTVTGSPNSGQAVAMRSRSTSPPRASGRLPTS